MLRRAGGMYSFVDCLSHLTIDHASLSRRSTVPTPNADTSSIWALSTFVYYPIYLNINIAYRIPFLFGWGGGEPDLQCKTYSYLFQVFRIQKYWCSSKGVDSDGVNTTEGNGECMQPIFRNVAHGEC